MIHSLVLQANITCFFSVSVFVRTDHVPYRLLLETFLILSKWSLCLVSHSRSCSDPYGHVYTASLYLSQSTKLLRGIWSKYISSELRIKVHVSLDILNLTHFLLIIKMAMGVYSSFWSLQLKL